MSQHNNEPRSIKRHFLKFKTKTYQQHNVTEKLCESYAIKYEEEKKCSTPEIRTFS